MMTREEAKELLNGCERHELRDHAFGDAEIFWENKGEVVAEGYFGASFAEVWIKSTGVRFTNDFAWDMRKCGELGETSRNDETGPDTYIEGQIMRGLTLEGVREELTGN